MIITQITTGLPPQIDGVGDYALHLANALFDRGVCSGFVIPPTQLPPTASAFPIRVLTRRNASDLASALEALSTQTTLLHFSGYGYAGSGLCWWLVEGV